MRKICLRCGSKFGSQAEYCPHDGSVLIRDDELADPLLGTMLLEQFRVERQIGVGGMGTVYRAHQTTVGRDVAIKILRPELARDEQAVVRFEREARLATSLDHPNLVRVFLSGRLADGRLYIVMELLEGRSLAEELEERDLPSIERALVIIMKLCAALGAVHDAGVVHRDIKPENVYLVQRGRDPDFVKLVDFGIARVLDADPMDPTTTQSGRVFGTATYISPEAAIGEDTDHRSDIYSLGVLAYQLLTGELPFEGNTAASVLMQHVNDEPPPMRTKGRGAEVPERVAQVIMRSLRKEPAARQQTLPEFLDSLAQAAGDAGLLQDARARLIGTLWGDELAAPGSYMAALLASSASAVAIVSTSPPARADTRRISSTRDPQEEALLSSAPKPFGTTSFDLAPPVRANARRRRHGWLWWVLGALVVAFVGLIASSWRVERELPAGAAESAPVERPSREPDVDESLAEPEPREAAIPDVGTETSVEQPEPPSEVVADLDEATEPPKAEPKKKQKRRPKRSPPAKASRPPGDQKPMTQDAELESDDGIDWTIPDFPEAPPPPTKRPSGAPPSSNSPAPTGTPDAPARNPVVIDEPPQ